MLNVKKFLPLFILAVGTACGGCDDPVVFENDVVVIDDDVSSDAGDTSDTSDVPDVTEEDTGPDAPPVEDTGPDVDDAGDDTNVPDMEMVDEFQACQADCNYMGPGADQFDCDYDGLSQTEEVVLGTDPCDNDSDGDGLNDRDELQQGTDPLLNDSDGDGLLDADEIFFGFDPNNPDSLSDNILDGDRWVVNACAEPVQTEPVNYYFSPKGDWQMGLPPAFNNYSELTIASATPQDKIAAAVFDDAANEVTGVILSDSPTAAQTNPVDVLLDVRQKLNQSFTLLQDTTGGEFSTHDFNQAAIGRYLLRSNQTRSARQIRDQIMFAIAPFGSADVTGLPNSSGNTYLEFRVFVSVSYRNDTNVGNRLIINAAIAPAEKFDSRDKVKFRMDDLTNTTNVAQTDDQLATQCRTFRAGEDDPTADFYWVLDQSGSMSDDFVRVKGVANPFFATLQNTALDYRLGVTTMDEDFFGRPRTNVAWFTDLPTFIAEIDEVQNGPYDGGTEHGLRSAQDGIEWMRSTQAPQSLRIRPNAQLITVFMSDEEDQSIKDLGGAGSTNGQQQLAQYTQFFPANTIAFSIVGTGGGCGEDGIAYRQVAFATGGTDASLCATDVQETIDAIIVAAAGLASNYQLGQTPISSSLRVFKNAEWVPRSRENGFDYFANSNSIAFFGTFRPVPADPTIGRYGDDIAVSFATYRNTTKNE